MELLHVMIEIFGNYINEFPENSEYLVVGFSPTSIPLKRRWRNNGLSADFIADYLQTFFVTEDQAVSQKQIQVKKNAVKYIANELLENAMKFSDEAVHYSTRIAFHLHSDSLIFHVTNSISADNIEKLKIFIRKVEVDDAYDLYFHQMEANANEGSQGHSGLGFLSMICDYGAKLGWRFEVLELNNQSVTTVTTMVYLSL
jgi:hypothetical protein